MADYVLGTLYEDDENLGKDSTLVLTLVTFNGYDRVEIDPDEWPGVIAFVDPYTASIYAEDDDDPRLEVWKKFLTQLGDSYVEQVLEAEQGDVAALAQAFTEAFQQEQDEPDEEPEHERA